LFAFCSANRTPSDTRPDESVRLIKEELVVTSLIAARMAEPQAVARVLRDTVRVGPAGGDWLADLRGFDGQEWRELSDTLRAEGVALADRSKLRRLTAAPTSWTLARLDRDGGSNVRRVQSEAGSQD
jgi:hypothetical protein